CAGAERSGQVDGGNSAAANHSRLRATNLQELVSKTGCAQPGQAAGDAVAGHIQQLFQTASRAGGGGGAGSGLVPGGGAARAPVLRASALRLWLSGYGEVVPGARAGGAGAGN